MHASPPDTTEIVGVNHVATRPASKSPRRGPPATTKMKIWDILPRRLSGVSSCVIVFRKIAEITSAAPASARKNSASARWAPTRPNAVMAAPHATTAQMTAVP